MSRQELLDQIQKLAPWHHHLELGNGLSTSDQPNLDTTGKEVTFLNAHSSFQFATEHVLPNGMEGRSFLDCACNAGGYSFAAKDAGASRTYGFDVRDHWINQANFVLENREEDSSGMAFEVADLMQIGAGDQEFDVTWFSGIFYHLPDPVTGLKYAADRTKELLFLNTACSPYVPGDVEVPALHYKKEGVEEVMSGVHELSWLPSGPKVLKGILKWLGFAEAKIYYWQVNLPDRSKQNRASRIGIVAAREPGRLDGLTELSAPTDVKPLPKSTKPAASELVKTASVKETAPKSRPQRWEDDFSCNAMDAAPFSDRPPISTWDDAEFEARTQISLPANLRSLPLLELKNKDQLPIPNSEDREGYSKGQDARYWISGLRDYEHVQAAARTRDIQIDRVLDIGCASGRVLRHFACQSDTPEIWGTDINGRHIRWLSKVMPQNVKPVFVPALPSLPFEDNYFDVVTAFSVFTHVDTFESAFLSEIRRILRPGGLAYLTAHTEPTWEAWREQVAQTGSALSEKVAQFSGLKDDLAHPMTQDVQTYRRTEIGPYRTLSFHKADYIRATWGRFLTVEEIIPMQHNLQTCILARK
ncbi:class I SAM-dependent methyltransferase [Tropicibacter sp. R15_0]|uniref:class I SAM-dependent methyltransferase n=1 Tax=Tropicibacter sp. R15_0 TaxID=2821101 RepID=UPI001ADB1696|nr:class I SAM-dependent methyltransferase [Tropicibacter sp. R15_0]MBO9468466.1 class I SAM-dependent methyltransferase [Tropicibacter sp. R15_0]